MVLARKWRPKKFADLVGQQTSTTVLKNILASHRLHHAYLLTGTRGVGKTTIARIIARALNCLNLTAGEPCGSCENCQQIDKGSFVDVIEIDAASNTGVDNIRELIDNAQYAPTSGQYKVYIIDEVHMLSKAAFNAMLKTLEEPPQHVIFILATTDLQKVPITILSRCLQLKLRNLLSEEISTHLSHVLKIEQIAFEELALHLIAKAALGSMRDALSLLDQAIAYTNSNIRTALVRQMLGLSDDKLIYELLIAISELESKKLTTIANEIYTTGYDLEQILRSLSIQLCNISMLQLTGAASTQLTTTIDDNLTNLISTLGINEVQLYFEIVNLGLEQIGKAQDKYPIFIMTLLRMLAFTIGSTTQKQIVIQNSNFYTEHTHTNVVVENKAPTAKEELSKSPPQEITATQISQTAEFAIQKVPTPEEETLTEVSPAVPLETTFNGNWFKLVEELKNDLGVLYPFVENSQLVSYSATELQLSIDQRYEASLNESAITKLNCTLSNHFGYAVTLKISFAQEVNNTLKERILNDKAKLQQLAENEIATSPKINEILSRFSAKIMPGSIKPISN
jgi:DNA polymerase-3 subunit gamma/tau